MISYLMASLIHASIVCPFFLLLRMENGQVVLLNYKILINSHKECVVLALRHERMGKYDPNTNIFGKYIIILDIKDNT